MTSSPIDPGQHAPRGRRAPRVAPAPLPPACARLALLALLAGGCRDAPGRPAPLPAAPAPAPAPAPAAEPERPVAGPSAAPSPLAPPGVGPLRLIFVGDIAMTGVVARNLALQRRGGAVPREWGGRYPFQDVTDALGAADVCVANLECVASDAGTAAILRNPFRAPAYAIDALKDAGISAVTVANNHAMDFGEAGLRGMLKNLEAAGLPAAGGRGLLTGREGAPVVLLVKGVRIGLLGYSEVRPAAAYEEVARARPLVDLLIVYNHWGLEYSLTPIEQQRRFGRGLLDAGADIVVGAHTHTLLPAELRGGKLLAYGLGNFVFAGARQEPGVHIGGLLEATFEEGRVVSSRMRRVRTDASGAPHLLPDSEDP